MNAANLNDPRALDLSALSAAAPASAPATPTGTFVVEADDRTFEAVVARSMQHPVVLELYSPRANAGALSDDLAALANAAGGRYLLVRLDVDASPAVASALGVQAVPMVVGVLGGQLVPLFQGTRDKADCEAVIGQLLQAAVANGIVGRATPVTDAAADADAAAGPDPRFAEADAALQSGDFALAVEEFDKLLAQTPADAEALAGRAQARLLVRLQDVDLDAVVAAADTAGTEGQLAMADVELANGHAEAAFARLVAVVRSGEGREEARTRLLELFEAVGASDPAVLKARRELMSALF